MHIKFTVGCTLLATSAVADVGLYREMAKTSVLEGDRYYSQKKQIRAIESYLQVLRNNPGFTVDPGCFSCFVFPVRKPGTAGRLGLLLTGVRREGGRRIFADVAL